MLYLEHLARLHAEELRRQAARNGHRARRPRPARLMVGRWVGVVR